MDEGKGKALTQGYKAAEVKTLPQSPCFRD